MVVTVAQVETLNLYWESTPQLLSIIAAPTLPNQSRSEDPYKHKEKGKGGAVLI